MISIGRARLVNLGPRSFNALGMKEVDSIFGIERGQIFLLAAGKTIELRGCSRVMSSTWLSIRTEAIHPRKSPARVDGRTQVRAFRSVILLVGGIQAGIGAQLALEAIQHQQKLLLSEQRREAAQQLIDGVGGGFPVAGVAKCFAGKHSE